MFGGYTSSGWYGNHEQDIFDDEAFIFLIRSNRKYEPQIFNVIEPERAIKLQPGWYCMFGCGNIEIYVNGAGNDLDFNGGAGKQSVVYERYPCDYYFSPVNYPNYERIEVFQLIKVL